MKARRSMPVVGAEKQRQRGKLSVGMWRKPDEKGDGAIGDGGVGDGWRFTRGQGISVSLCGEDGESVGNKFVDGAECCEPSRLTIDGRRRESVE